ncbi:hypothetical protein F5884DRAFT_862252 [Xylogone sp. PMI_703]|nr:hypothetical protein F5884DRAFT_862252 [Xylogone sp. PMI_703]
MTTTMTITESQASTVGTLSTHPQCPHCGTDLPEIESESLLEAQRQIKDLQAQVRMLTQKATAAVDRWADYEDEIQKLRSQQQRQSQSQQSQAIPDIPLHSSPQQQSSPSSERNASPSRISSYLPVQNRLSSFLTSRKPLPAQAAVPATNDLVAALNREQSLRAAAESKLSAASGELEELSAQLFMQANEMVATERKARAKLEERVAILEKRDVDKRKRLERLEGAVARIERVKGLLAPGR